jgi:hypothetical protein
MTSRENCINLVVDWSYSKFKTVLNYQFYIIIYFSCVMNYGSKYSLINFFYSIFTTFNIETSITFDYFFKIWVFFIFFKKNLFLTQRRIPFFKINSIKRAIIF